MLNVRYFGINELRQYKIIVINFFPVIEVVQMRLRMSTCAEMEQPFQYKE